MSENNDTQNTDPSINDIQASDPVNVWTDASEQALQDLTTCLYNAEDLSQQIYNLMRVMVDFVSQTNINPFIVNDILSQITELLAPLPDLAASFFVSAVTYDQKYSEFMTLPLANDHIMWWMPPSLAYLVEYVVADVAKIHADKEILESRKTDDETEAAVIQIMQAGIPLLEMYSGTMTAIDSMSTAYNRLYRDGYNPVKKDLDGNIKDIATDMPTPPTREEIFYTVDLINTFLANIFDALSEREATYAEFETVVASLSEKVKNYYFVLERVQEVEMFNNMIPVYEGLIEQIQKAINDELPIPGPKGDAGSKGDKGNKGDKGDAGPSGTLTLDYFKLGLIFGGGAVIGAIITTLMMFFI